MKTVACKKTVKNYPRVAYPNAATGKEMLHKFLDGLLMLVSAAGIVTVRLFALMI